MITINGSSGTLNSNLNWTISTNGGTGGGGAVASVTATGGLVNIGANTGAVVIALSDATTNSLPKADSALQDASTWSQHAASQMIDFGSQSVTNIGTLFYVFGRLQDDGAWIDTNNQWAARIFDRKLYDFMGASIFNWDGINAFFDSPNQLRARDITPGTLTTNLMDATADQAYRHFTNGTTMSDGTLGGTNGVYWSKGGTNYWILLP
jgi:hypothetical protein